MTDLSIVIPTYRRPATLVDTLSRLALQNVAPRSFDVIVVADGEDEGSLSAARELDLPFDLSLHSQPHGGAASARRRGSREARAPIVLFLDDDMAAGPGLVATHLSRHSDPSTDVVLGHFTHATSGLKDPFFATNVRTWWSRRFAQLAEPGHRYRFSDLFSGHFSVKRDLLSTVGGFDERYTHEHSGEDYELGIRLLSAGARFTYARNATAVHMDDPTVARTLGRAFADGRGHVIMARKHPGILTSLPLSSALHDGKLAGLRRSPTVRKSTLSLALARAMKLRGLWGASFGVAHRRAYWAGALKELGSPAELRRLLQEAELEPFRGGLEASFDIRTGYAGLVDTLSSGRVEHLSIWAGEIPICRLPRADGAEPLRPIHVVEWLARHQAPSVVRALIASGWRLDGGESVPRPRPYTTGPENAGLEARA